ncbi:hypothetical protein Pmani_027343 [Petrolisthes manimaculis]|uniref:Uncharacterized protein n=1 Tax=Petrolisthes manimaculis TaxID=1843537 RepID=A0AAE1P2W0_9EUCA|nr:hypothetical protein Pmani_027343 [Petrolisthes manimaculis]
MVRWNPPLQLSYTVLKICEEVANMHRAVPEDWKGLPHAVKKCNVKRLYSTPETISQGPLCSIQHLQ